MTIVAAPAQTPTDVHGQCEQVDCNLAHDDDPWTWFRDQEASAISTLLSYKQPSGHDRLTVRTAPDPPKGRHLDRVATACAEPIGSNRSENFTGRRLGRRRMAKRSARGASTGFHRHGRRTWSMSLVFILGRDLTSNGGSRPNLQIREPIDDQPVVAGSVEAKARAANVLSTFVQGSQLHRG